MIMKGASVRLIVAGSGVVGAACAYAAVSLGADVVLVDAAMQGRATAAGAGIICPWASRENDPIWYSFARQAARNYPDLLGRLADDGEPDIGYRKVGAIALADDEESMKQIRCRLLTRREEAPEIGDVHDLTGAEAQRMFPPLRADTLAVFVGGAARVDGRLLAAALIKAAVRRGAAVREGVARLACRAGRAIGVTIGGELAEADAVVAATGAWTRSFLEPSGVTVHVKAQRGQIAHISLGSADTRHWPVVLPGRSGHYMLAFDDSRVVAGATRETGSGFDYRVTPGGLAEVLGEALTVAPGLASGTYAETRVGFRPMGPDIRPLLGPVSAVAGLVVATGLGATGLTMGPYAGAVAARVAMGLPTDVDLAPLDPLRPCSGPA
jgi:D-amino-acid dehydrogenase